MLKLIIADDEKLIRDVLSRCTDWASLGVELVAVCKDGLETFDAIQKYKPQLVLTDIKMPGMSGLELAAYFSKRESYVLEFLFLTGYEEFDFALSAIESGVHHYLVKPISEARLADAIRQACDEVNQKIATTKEQKVLQGTVFYSDCVRQIFSRFLVVNAITSVGTAGVRGIEHVYGFFSKHFRHFLKCGGFLST